MPNTPPDTVKILEDLIEDINSQLELVDKKRAILLEEKERAEKALYSIKPKRRSRRVPQYIKDNTLKQKVIFCLRHKMKIASISDMMNILMEFDEDIKADEKNTENSVRLAVFRLEKEGRLIRYKTDEMKSIHYALDNWANEKGEIVEEFLQ